MKPITRVNKKRERIAQLYREIDEIHNSCDHPLNNLSIVHKSNTGNYDYNSDSYWTVFECSHCGKKWREDGSLSDTKLRNKHE